MPTASSGCSVSQIRQRSVVAGNSELLSSRSTSSEPVGSAGLGTLLSRLPRLHRAGSLSLSRCEREWPARGTTIHTKAMLREQIEREARAAGEAAAALRDDAVSAALQAAAAVLRERRADVLAANRADVHAAEGTLDEGTVDRLRLDDARLDALATQVEATAGLEPLEREIGTRSLPNGLVISERRIPIGTVGANFEARPNVALDVAGQLLKSLNAAVLRTGGAALRTVTVLVDDVLRPALERAGLPAAVVGLVRSPEREGARALVSLPALIPLVILRGSGPST